MIIRSLCLALLVVMPGSVLADGLKPYVLAGMDEGTRQEAQTRAEERLTAAGFEVVGSYSPAEDDNLGVVCVTHEDLKASAAQAGGLRGFAAVLRIGLNQTDDGVEVTYTHPLYWGNAYYGKAFPQVQEIYNQLEEQFREAFADLPESRFEPFGSKKGIRAAKLQKYHYMISMPYFDDVVVLDTDSSYDDAVARIESRAAKDDSEVEIIYSVKIPEVNIALFGTALTGEKGEKEFLHKIDLDEPRHVPFLPYELLVLEDKVVSLHGRYRIALSFPDLSMGTFMKISSTPGDIADAHRTIAAE